MLNPVSIPNHRCNCSIQKFPLESSEVSTNEARPTINVTTVVVTDQLTLEKKNTNIERIVNMLKFRNGSLTATVAGNAESKNKNAAVVIVCVFVGTVWIAVITLLHKVSSALS